MINMIEYITPSLSHSFPSTPLLLGKKVWDIAPEKSLMLFIIVVSSIETGWWDF